MEKFDDFLDKMKGLLDNAKKMGHIIVRVEDIENTFPELKESENEDEKIRKAIIEGLKEMKSSFHAISSIKIDDALAWLEKQGEQSIQNVPSRETILNIWDLGNEWKKLTSGSISTEHGTQLSYIQKHWQEGEYYLRAKQGEQNPTWSEDDKKMFINIKACLRNADKDYGKELDWLMSLRPRGNSRL